MTPKESQRAVVLFGHGSRDPLWHKPMEAVMARVQAQQPGLAVTCAYLELSQPDLPTASRALIDKGITHIAVVPMFLGVGRHAREDLPHIVAELAQAHPQVEFTLRPAVGEDPRLLQVLSDIAASPD